MSLKTSLILLVFPVALTLISSCEAPSSPSDTPKDMPIVGTPDNFDYGKVENGVYTNKYFNCSMKTPKGWAVQNDEETALITEQSKNLMEKNGVENVDAALINTANLLTIFHHSLDSIQLGNNPSIILMAENTSRRPDIKTGKDYLVAARGMFAKSGQPIEIDNEVPIREVINGHEFYLTKTSIGMPGMTAHQQYRATVIKGFTFIAICTFFSPEEEKTLMASLNTLKFKK